MSTETNEYETNLNLIKGYKDTLANGVPNIDGLIPIIESATQCVKNCMARIDHVEAYLGYNKEAPTNS